MRVADGEARRKLNDDRRRLFVASPLIAFICECGDPGCFTTVSLSGDEFDLLRQTPPYLLLADSHHAAVAPPQANDAILSPESPPQPPNPPPA